MNNLVKITKYVFVGGCTTLVNIISYWISADILNLDYRVSTMTAWVAAVIFAYVTNKIFVFQSNTPNFKETIVEMTYFFGFRALSLGIDLVFMILLVSILSINDLLAKIFSNVFVLVSNYIFSQKYIFNRRKQN